MAGLFDDLPDATKSAPSAPPSALKPTADLFGDIAPAGSWTDNLRDPLAGALKIGPTAVKGVADIARLLTGDTIGGGLSDSMQSGMRAIDQAVGSDRLRHQQQQVANILQSDEFGMSDIPGMVADNPRAAVDAAISTIGSMFLPTGAAVGATRALPSIAKVAPIVARVAPATVATGTTIATGAAQNAAETFADTEGEALGDRYKGAAISGAISAALGGLMGGGAEGLVARRLAGESVARGAAAAAKSAATTGAKEFVQEFGEEGGNTLSKQVARGEDIDPQAIGKQGLYGGIIGMGVGGASDVATNVGNIGAGADARMLARELDQAAQEFADTPVTAGEARSLFADLPNAPRTPESVAETVAGNADGTSATQGIEQQNQAAVSGQQPAPGEAARAVGGDQQAAGLPDAGSSGVEAAGVAPVLQNRDRSTPGSVTQMQSIASNPDYGRLGFSRDFANGAPVVAGGQEVPELQLGRQDVAVASDGRRIPVQYAVVEAADVLPSNQVDGAPNADYATATDRMRAIAGNGRIAGLQAAHQRGTGRAYVDELLADNLHGINPDVVRGMRQPVLVRIMPTSEVTADIGDVSNTVGNMDLSAVEQARNDAQRVDLDALQFAEDGGITAEAARAFVRGMPQAEHGALLDTNGQPTRQAIDRLNAAVFSRAYGNDGLVRLYAQAQDPEARLVLSALARLAPKMARLEGAGALDFRDVVAQAAELAVNARRAGRRIADAAAQMDMAADPMVGVVLDLFARNPRSNREAIEQLGRAADMAYAEANKADTDMFGAVPKASRADVFKQMEPATNEQASPQNLEQPQGPGPVSNNAQGAPAQPAAPADTGRAEAGRPAESEAGAASAGAASDPTVKLAEAQDQQAQDATEIDARAESPRRSYNDGQANLFGQTDTGKQLGLWLDSEPDPSQTGARVEAARSAAAKAVEDIHDTKTILGLALSRDYAARQRVSLLGQHVFSHHDLALLAQVYRDPRFETFRLVFVNDSGKVVSQIGLTSRLPAAAVAVVGSDVDAYLSDIAKAAHNTGATGFYMLHNHPSGSSAASRADQNLTRSFARRMPTLKFHDHVVIDTNEYTTIDSEGLTRTIKKDFGQPAPMTYSEYGGKQIRSPADVMAMAKQMEVTKDAVTLITVDNQLKVRGVTAIPADALSADRAATKRALLKATMRQQGGRVIAVGRNPGTLRHANGMVVDAVWVKDDGSVQSMGETGGIQVDGQLFPDERAPRLSPDTSQAFAYLREQAAPKPNPFAKAAEDGGQYGQSPAEVAKQIEAEFPGVKLDLFGRPGGPWNLSRIVVPSGAREAGTGTQVMQRVIDAADQSGATVTLTPSADFGGSKARLVPFYKRFGFVENKGRNKDYEISESMYRSPQSIRVESPQAKYRSTTGGNVNSLASAAAPWTVPEPGTGDAFIRAIQNNKIDLKRLRDTLAEQYGPLPSRADAYLSEELYHGKIGARVDQLRTDYLEPLLGKIAVAGKNAGVTVDDVNLYLHARHAPERNAAMQKINPGMANNDALSGMSDAQAAATMARFAADGKDAALKAIAADVDQLLTDTRTNLVADGLEDAGVVQAWEAAYKHYVPLQREAESQGSGASKGMGFSVKGPEAKRAVGSNREVVNILANIVAQAETAAIRAEKAEVGRTLLEMARTYPNPEFWKVDVVPTKPRINKDTGLVERNAIDPLYKSADNVVVVKDQGQEHFIVFNKNSDRAMAVAHAMKNLDAAPMNKLLTAVGHGTRFLASMLTARNPVFWLTNFSRDIQGAMLNLEGTDAEGLQREVLGNLGGAFKGMHALVRGDGRGQWARYAQELKGAGGTTGYMQIFENSDKRMGDIRKEVARMQQGKADPRRLARQLLEFVDDYNDIIENAVRLSVFQAARDSGVATERAASIAKNITVNFNRKGNLTPVVNSLYMFFNASVQGTARLAQLLVSSRKAQVAVGGIAMIGFLLDALNRAMSDDDEETGRNRYDLIPEFEKSKNWIIMNPMRPGEYVKIPLPLGPHVFHNAGRLLSDAMFRDDPRNAAEYSWAFVNTMMDAFSPLGETASMGQLIAPSIADPVLQLAENKSFTGAPVYKSAERGFGPPDPKPAYTRHFDSTPSIWKQASRTLNDITGGDKQKPGLVNIEPDILKHIAWTLTGGPGRTVDQAVDSLQAGARGVEMTPNRLPLASRFYGANDDRQRERVYYDDKKRVEQAKASFDYFNKNGRRDLAREVAEELGNGDYSEGLKMMRGHKGSSAALKKINSQIKREMERADSGEDRAEQLKALRKRRTEMMSRTVNRDDGEE